MLTFPTFKPYNAINMLGNRMDSLKTTFNPLAEEKESF